MIKTVGREHQPIAFIAYRAVVMLASSVGTYARVTWASRASTHIEIRFDAKLMTVQPVRLHRQCVPFMQAPNHLYGALECIYIADSWCANTTSK